MTITLNGAPITFDVLDSEDMLPDPYCARCGRCTDHTGEHDGSHLAGLVEYGTAIIDGVLYSTGEVSWTPVAYRLMDAGVNVRALSVNLDDMAYAAWERSPYIWQVNNEGGRWIMKNGYGCVDTSRIA